MFFTKKYKKILNKLESKAESNRVSNISAKNYISSVEKKSGKNRIDIDLIESNVADLSEKFSSISTVKGDKRTIQEFLDDKHAYLAPQGDFEIKKSLVWSVSKNIDWGNCNIVIPKNLNALKIQAKKFGCINFSANGELINDPNPDFAFVTLQYRNEHQQFYHIRDASITGNMSKIFKEEGVGNVGIKHDPFYEFQGSLAPGIEGENHFSVIENYMPAGLHTGIVIQHTLNDVRRGNSRHEVSIQGLACKRVAHLKAGRINLSFKYNNTYSLIGEEKDYGVVEIDGSWNKIKGEFPDHNKGKKPKTNHRNKTFYAHKYAVVDRKNYGNTYDVDYGEILKVKSS